MISMNHLRTRVDPTLSRIDAENKAAPHHGLEPRPDVRNALIADERLRAAVRDEIRITSQLVAKCSARVERARATLAQVLDATTECERRAAVARTDVERVAWLEGPPFLRGERGFAERPGAVIALARESGVDHLPTLPTCEEIVAQAEADLAPQRARLLAALDTWDARNAATMTADLPTMQMSATATVKARAS